MNVLIISNVYELFLDDASMCVSSKDCTYLS